MRFYIETTLTFLVAFAAATATAWFTLSYLAGLECKAYEEVTGRKTKLVYATCYVNVNNQWFTYEEMKIRNATKGE